MMPGTSRRVQDCDNVTTMYFGMNETPVNPPNRNLSPHCFDQPCGDTNALTRAFYRTLDYTVCVQFPAKFRERFIFPPVAHHEWREITFKARKSETSYLVVRPQRLYVRLTRCCRSRLQFSALHPHIAVEEAD